MSSLSSIYLKKETLQTLLDVVTKKGEKGLELTVSLSDETNQYEQNVSAWVSQSKEQREAKKERFYAGNGKTFWTDGKITVAVKKAEVPDGNRVMDVPPIGDVIGKQDDLPF